MKRDHHQADLKPRDVAMLDFALKISQRRDEVSQADISRLRDYGFSDADILHIIMWTANFNLANTLTAAVGLEPHENMSALFVDALPTAARPLFDAPGPAGLEEQLRPEWERAVVRPLEGLELPWLNSDPLTWADVRGRVLLVILWDVMHANSLVGLSYWQRWHDAYAAQGALVLGVHTGELQPAKDANLATDEIKRLGVTFPVVLDATYRRMAGANNRFWPAIQLVDQKGFVRFRSYGPGHYQVIEQELRALLIEGPPASRVDEHRQPAAGDNPFLHAQGVPDLYASYLYGSHRYGIAGAPGSVESFVMPQEMEPDQLHVGGRWRVCEQHLALVEGKGSLAFRYQAAEAVTILAAPGSDTASTLTVFLDGKPVPTQHAGADLTRTSQVTIDSPRVYQLLKHPSVESHKIEVQVTGPGTAVYRFSSLPFRGVVDE